MVIGVDCGSLSISDERLKVGVYRLTLALLRALLSIDQKNSYYFYSFSPLDKNFFPEFKNWKNITVIPKTGWFSLWLPKRISKDQPDLFIGFSQSLPRLPKSTKSIVFIYDLTFEQNPSWFLDSYKKMSENTKNAIKRADKIISVSKSTKKEIIKRFKISSDKIEIIYGGFDQRLNKISQKEAGKRLKLLGIGEKFFLFVGTFKQSKNIPNIIRAFDKFNNKSYLLVLVGSNFWLDEQIQNTVNKTKNKDLIKILDFVDDNLLEALYTKASGFISPSFNEGFGLTYVEASYYGLPIIAADRGSVKEVISNGALYVDPNNISEIEKGLETLLTNKVLVKKTTKTASLSVRKFSYQNSAKKLLTIINSYEK